MTAHDVGASFRAVVDRVERATAHARRAPGSVCLVAVSKLQPADAVRAAHAAGARVFGENYAQELRAKQEALADLAPEWHFVGRLQRNKAKDMAGRTALVHSIDGLELAAALDHRAAAAGAVQRVLVEVNLAGETTKGGVAPEALPDLLAAMAPLPALRCVGLMTMPPPAADPEANRPTFRQLAGLAARLSLPELSMGMSDDFEVAIEEGATIVRVGTAIFGPRP